jgi:thioredoxin-like negative regulator of GroEL
MTANSPTHSNTLRNVVIVLTVTLLSVAIFFGLRTQSATASLPDLAATAVPYEVAQTNGKPTLMEFYANWCISCQAMAGDMASLRDTYGDRVNFVMLNVDNNKWLPEMLQYRVDGIPHFVYLSAQAEPIAAAIGEQPRAILAANLEALLANATLPHQQTMGQASGLDNDPLSRQAIINDDPRAHGSQVSGVVSE